MGSVISFLPSVDAEEPAGSGTEVKKPRKGLNQTQIKGLLVIKLGNGTFAGTASQMNATVVDHTKGFEIGFNQNVGDMMTKATSEVDKFIRVRYSGKLPSGMRVELSFADKYSPKDGPSAAVVCALMVDSILSGKTIDPGFAATGDMTATGDVQPVGGVASKIKGAIRKKCSHVGIPIGNKPSITDAYLLKGIKPLYSIQIFSIKTFDQASALAIKDHPENIQGALDEFTKIQAVLKKNEKLVFNKKVRDKLRKVVQLAPNHLSARLLYLHSVSKGPKKLSLMGSITGVDNAGEKLVGMIKNRSFLQSGGLNGDVLTDLVYEIARLRPMLDKRTIKYADSYLNVSAFIKRYRSRKKFSDQLIRELNQLANMIDIERERLLNNEEVREELMAD
jgi:hypothetical protein